MAKNYLQKYSYSVKYRCNRIGGDIKNVEKMFNQKGLANFKT